MGLHALTLTLILILYIHIAPSLASTLPVSSPTRTLQASPPPPSHGDVLRSAAPNSNTKTTKKLLQHLLLDRFHPGSSSLRGRRPRQEDRIACFPRLEIFPSGRRNESSGNVAGMFAVFDGHLGDSASDFAAKSIRERFLYRVNSRAEVNKNAAHFNLSSSSVLQLLIFEEALRGAITDIDTDFRRVNGYQRNGMASGSTAAVALKVGDQLLVANVGDSKVLVCSSCKRDLSFIREPSDNQNRSATALSRRERRMMKKYFRHNNVKQNKHENSELGLCVREVSSDHHPDRPEEKLRIEASGGYVTTTGSYARVNGKLAVSRSIGDVDLKKFGVIADPELSGWFSVSEEEKFLVLASDGIFEKLTPQEVCNVIHGLASGQDIQEVMEAFLMQEDRGTIVAFPLPVSFDCLNSQNVNAIHSQDIGPASTDIVADINACHIGVDSCTSSMELWEADSISKGNSIFLDSAYAYTDVCHSAATESSNYMELWNVASTSKPHDSTCIPRVMAQVLTQLAFEAGSMDNLSVVVVPLKLETSG